MGMKIDVGFIHILITVEILVLLCALHLSKHCVVLQPFKSPVCETYKKRTVRWNLFTGAYFF